MLGRVSGLGLTNAAHPQIRRHGREGVVRSHLRLEGCDINVVPHYRKFSLSGSFEFPPSSRPADSFTLPQLFLHTLTYSGLATGFLSGVITRFSFSFRSSLRGFETQLQEQRQVCSLRLITWLQKRRLLYSPRLYYLTSLALLHLRIVQVPYSLFHD